MSDENDDIVDKIEKRAKELNDMIWKRNDDDDENDDE